MEKIVLTSNLQTRSLRILMKIRHDALTSPGGDTSVLNNLTQELKKLGHTVDIDTDNTTPVKNYDILHLHNMSHPYTIQQKAEEAYSEKVPYIVTALYEDRPEFLLKMFVYSEVCKFIPPALRGVPPDRIIREIKNHKAAQNPRADFIANNAEAIIVSGQKETEVINREYPEAKHVQICHFGSNFKVCDDGGSLFFSTYGIKDFILCVGRIEAKKNQLNLLKALKDSEIPIVFVGGDIVHEADYENLCKSFKRSGQNHFLPRLSDEMLSSAYSACKVHALPSWWELPGLVSLEAALHGKNVVSPINSTLHDYLGNDAYYCDPENLENIKEVVLAAYYAGDNNSIKKRAEKFTWENCAKQYVDVYYKALGINTKESKKHHIPNHFKTAPIELLATSRQYAKI